MLKTTFWRNAANSLPAPISARHLAQFERAEQWELGLDAVIEAYKAFTRQLHALLPHAN